jgi:hypothetical protein
VLYEGGSWPGLIDVVGRRGIMEVLKEFVSVVEKDENNIYWSFERTYHGPYRKVLLFPVFKFSLIFVFPLFTYYNNYLWIY